LQWQPVSGNGQHCTPHPTIRNGNFASSNRQPESGSWQFYYFRATILLFAILLVYLERGLLPRTGFLPQLEPPLANPALYSFIFETLQLRILCPQLSSGPLLAMLYFGNLPLCFLQLAICRLCLASCCLQFGNLLFAALQFAICYLLLCYLHLAICNLLLCYL